MAAVHALVAGYCAAVAQQWVSVSGGRADLASMLTPSAAGFPGLQWAAALSGAVLCPFLHRAARRIGRGARRPQLRAAMAGVVYALAVMLLATALWIPWLMVSGRGPTESVPSALGSALIVIGLGMPVFLLTGVLLFAPVLLVGGAVVGLTAMALERRYLPTIS